MKNIRGELPTVGRVVRYQSHGSPNGQHRAVERAAMVTAVFPLDADVQPAHPVSIVVFNPTGLYFEKDCPYSELPKPGCWSWPPELRPAAAHHSGL